MKISHTLSGARSFKLSLRRIKRDNKGVAAVEFALILPLMLTLYFGSAEITQGVLASRKMALLSRTLSDLVAQQSSASTTDCPAAGVCDITMGKIFAAASVVMSPFSTANLSSGPASLTMTISAVEVKAKSASTVAGNYWPNDSTGQVAIVRWSKVAASPNVGTKRDCTKLLIPSDNTNHASITTLPKGLFATGSLIVADVTYKYSPGFGGAVLAWVSADGATYIAMTNTTYMRPRNWTTFITYDETAVSTGGVTGGANCKLISPTADPLNS